MGVVGKKYQNGGDGLLNSFCAPFKLEFKTGMGEYTYPRGICDV